ncbi:MAG: A24 family peptidase [Rhodoferax sp.]|nr:A24 family peptidase [Rhodoferax sp.]
MQDLYAVFGAILGLLVGSFLNVVVHRLPRMMERQWKRECADLCGTALPDEPPLNLMTPRSRCPHCGHQIVWYENVPVVSYLFLRGRCAQCKAPISVRYPVVELASSALFYFCIGNWGLTYTAFAWCVFCAALLVLALIDWDTTLLPDSITLPLLWLGLIAASLRWTSVGLPESLWGSIAGYGSLWTIYWAFKLSTGKEGMGYGDFKLFAALGAWFGWPLLVPLILIASVSGAVVGIGMKFTSGLREGGYVPFGPFLACAGFAAILLGPDRLRSFVLI